MLYILLSDRLLGAIATTPEAVTRLQTIKGAFYVAFTSVILYMLIRRGMAQLTEAHTAERKQHAYLHGVVHNTMDAVCIEDLDERFVLVNGAAERLLALPSSRILGHKVGELIPAALAARMSEAARVARESGQSRTIELDVERRDSRFWLLTFSPYRNDHGTVAGVVCVARDVTTQRESEDETRRSEARLRMLVEQVPAVMWSVDRDLRLTSLRGSGLATIGLAPDEGVGLPVAELTRLHDTADDTIASYGRALAGESVVFRAARDGQTYECHIEPYRGPDGDIAGVIGLGINITERTRAEQLLEEQEALLRQAQKMEAVGRLAGGLAHDFNNLLTIITSSAEFLQSSFEGDDSRREDVLEIRRAGDRAAVLVRELLAFSSQQLLQPAVLDLHEVLVDAQPLLARTITAHVKLRIDSRPDECIVKADKRQLELALINLAVNARDAMPRGGTLSMHCSAVTLERGRMLVDAGQEVAAGAYALLRVGDTGRGMDAQTRARIFEPFYSTKTHAPGGGLGLAVVYGIVTQSGGFIEVDSTPSAGTEFRIYLPLAERGSVLPPESSPDPPSARQIVVLVAEDEDAVRRLSRRILEREGFTVLEARDGQEALELCNAPGQRIDLVLSDVVMPRLGGRELVEQCLTLFPGCRALLMSGYTDDELVRRDVLDSRAAFLAKPFTPEALVRKVREALEAPVAG
jgi:two-component system cell cycle sensor histidine kinase/response regulator CckA